jgi:hypothetical protein
MRERGARRRRHLRHPLHQHRALRVEQAQQLALELPRARGHPAKMRPVDNRRLLDRDDAC